VSPFFKGEFDDDLTYSPLSKGVRGLFLLHFLYFLTITIKRKEIERFWLNLQMTSIFIRFRMSSGKLGEEDGGRRSRNRD
jgi:hypothetical protein